MMSMKGQMVTNTRNGSLSSITWFSLLAEFFIGLLLSTILFILKAIKSTLPKPPRDLTGDVVLVTGVTSSLGRNLAEKFAQSGCTIVCVDNDLELVRKTAQELSAFGIQSVGPDHHRKQDVFTRKHYAYHCDLWDRESIRSMAKQIRKDIGNLDVLITCVGNSGQDIFDTVNTTLMSHYWTVMAFLPSMLNREKGYIIGITPTTSMDDAYMGSRAAVAGLMESLGEEFGSKKSQLHFITVAPKANPEFARQNDEKVATEVLQAVKKDQCYLTTSWLSKILYHVSSVIYRVITIITQWLYTQGCDDFI